MTAEGDMTDQGAADAGISVTQRESPMEHLEGWFRGHEAQVREAGAGAAPSRTTWSRSCAATSPGCSASSPGSWPTRS